MMQLKYIYINKTYTRQTTQLYFACFLASIFLHTFLEAYGLRK